MWSFFLIDLPFISSCFRAWDEIFDVFGDGREYEWALDGDDGMEDHEDVVKPEMKYQDVSFPLA